MSTRSVLDLDALRRLGALSRLNGKDYLTHEGLLRVAHMHGLQSIHTEIVSWDMEARAAVVHATASGERGTYTGIGDACPANVSRNIASACLRMAETRAISRCLRNYCGIGRTSVDELPGGASESSAPPQDRTPAPAAAEAQPEEPTPVQQLRSVLFKQLQATSREEADMVARWVRRVNDTNECYWPDWSALIEDPEGPPFALAKIGKCVAQHGMTPAEVLQSAIDAHGKGATDD